MRYRSQNEIPMTTYHQLAYSGYDIKRHLAMEIIKEMSDEDFNKIFSTTIEERYEFNPMVVVTVELNNKK